MSTGTIIERFVSIKTIRERYESCPEPELPSLYPNAPEEVKPDKRKLLNLMKKAIENAYLRWHDDIQFYEERTPDVEEYMHEINTIKEIIRFIDPKIKPDRFIKNESFDTAFCREYLNRMKFRLWEEDIEDLKCLFHALQWLLHKKAEDSLEVSPNGEGVNLLDDVLPKATEKEDVETAMLRKFLENLMPYFKRGITFYLLFTARDICDNLLHKSYGKNVQQFALKIAPILDKSATSLNSQICQAGKELLIDGGRSYHSISTLTSKQINTVQTLQDAKLNEWKQRYELVKSLIPTEMLT